MGIPGAAPDFRVYTLNSLILLLERDPVRRNLSCFKMPAHRDVPGIITYKREKQEAAQLSIRGAQIHTGAREPRGDVHIFKCHLKK